METDTREVSCILQGYLTRFWQGTIVNQSHLASKLASSFLISPSSTNNSRIFLLYGFECKGITFAII